MVHAIFRWGTPVAKIGLWGALMYSVIGPTYALSRNLLSAHQFVETTRKILEISPRDAHRRSLYWLMEYTADRNEHEQATIRRFRRNIEDVLMVDCGTIDTQQYELPTLRGAGKGRYELRMECNEKKLVIPWGEIEWR